MILQLGLAYLALINIYGTCILCSDKQAAIKMAHRTPEKKLHCMEILGGIFIMLPAMYIINHKTSKPRYYIWSYFILFLWLAAIVYFSFLFHTNQNSF